MSITKVEDFWRGTSDTGSAVQSRAATTPAQRLEWLEENLLLAQACGALARERAERQRRADAWGLPLAPRPPTAVLTDTLHRPD